MKKALTVTLFCLITACFALPSHGGVLTSRGHEHAGWVQGASSYIYSHTPERKLTQESHDGFFTLPAHLSWANTEGSHTPQFDVPVVMNKKVQNFVDYFQGRGKGTMERWMERSGAYLPMIKTILSENDLPEDLAYLALIESGFSPYARSRAKAVGMWQFMRWTGKRYGLRVDWWVDERRDPEKATIAASKYLSHLYDKFDSWYLAAASYNAGEGRIGGAIRRHKTEDFWKLASYRRPLKKETKNYIPKFIAAMMIAKSPEQYGFTDIVYAEPLTYDKVTVSHPTDVRVIAKAAGATTGKIKKLNPELLRWFTPPGSEDYEVKIPAGTAKTFYENISKIPTPERLNFHKHRLRKGDTLWKIARRYGTSIRPIMHLNNIKNPRHLRPGQLVVVPVRARKGGYKKVASAKPVRRLTLNSTGTYTIRRGDTLWDIAVKHGIDVKSILKLNDLDSPGRIKPGQTIVLKKVMLEKNIRPTLSN